MVLRPSAMKAAAEQAKAAGMGGAQAAQAARQAAVQATGQAAQSAPVSPRSPRRRPRHAPLRRCGLQPLLRRGCRLRRLRHANSAAASPGQRSRWVRSSSSRGATHGKELELSKPLTTLGKPGVQVAVLTRRPQGYFITHVEGAQRPTVNGQPIGTAPHALKDHDLVEIAGIKMEFFHKN